MIGRRWVGCAVGVLGMVLAVGGNARADVPAAVHARAEVFLVHADARDPGSVRLALAAVSAAVRHDGTAVSQALVVTDGGDAATGRLVDRWRSTAGARGTARLICVGAVDAHVRDALVAKLAHPPVATIAGDLATASLALAATATAGGATPADPVECPVDVAPEVAALAAVAASVSGKALVYRAGAAAPDAAALRARILAGTRVNTLCLFDEPEQLVAATLAAAHYRGLPLALPGSLAARAARLPLPADDRGVSPRKLDAPPAPDRAARAGAQDVAAAFTRWLAAEGLDRPGALEVVMVFAKLRAWGFSGLPLAFDRALIGSPAMPERPGAVVGRLPLDGAGNLAVISRTTLCEALAPGSNDRLSQPRGRAVLSFVAYEANHTGPGSAGPFRDNAGVPHLVNELLGAPGEPGLRPMLASAGIHMSFNCGFAPAITASADPLEGSAASGFLDALNAGATLFYDTSHGWYDSFFPFAHDRSINADVAFGQPGWPARTGRLDTLGMPCLAGNLDRQLGDLHGLVAIFNACLVARGAIGPDLLAHGASAVLCATTQVDSPGAGWWGIQVVQALLDGSVAGEALARGLAATSDIFPAGVTGVDPSLSFVVLGDPHATLLRAPARR